MTPAPYRAPDLAAECASLRAEVARLRAKPARRFASGWSGVAEMLAATILIGGYHIGALILIVGSRVGPPWAVWVALVIGGVWWALGIMVARGAR